jgi:hypothetical protein
MNGWVVLIILLVIAAGFVLYAVSAYNSLVRMRNLVEESWRQVDVELNRRYELIPNLVETVRGYARHEQGTLGASSTANQAVGMGGQSHATEQRSGGGGALDGRAPAARDQVEAYPDLRPTSASPNCSASWPTPKIASRPDGATTTRTCATTTPASSRSRPTSQHVPVQRATYFGSRTPPCG